VTDSPFVEDDDQPFTHNPIRALPWLDTRVEVEVFQLRPTLEHRLAEWCDGEVIVDGTQLAVRIPGRVPKVARLGDFVVLDGEEFVVVPPDGFNLRFWPVGRDTGWSHRCFMNWEATS
jgi:hypothetical protein